MVIKIEKKYDSEFELYYTMISMYNVIENWGLTDTHISILIYLIRLGYSKDTKDIICKNINITEKSLTTTLSHLRQGKVGKRVIKKLLKTSPTNLNVTLLSTELKDIKTIVESMDENKAFYVKFNIDDNIEKIKSSNGKRNSKRSSKGA